MGKKAPKIPIWSQKAFAGTGCTPETHVIPPKPDSGAGASSQTLVDVEGDSMAGVGTREGTSPGWAGDRQRGQGDTWHLLPDPPFASP